ncbi:uncharacterized protein LOC122092392 [Macadamia integrifolia]|uniref:uncharacterized protein LOC122092392 n=1 Tax=Macadamia integrifolia TaxID=60698 RepID=UPI001C52B637|nr:uncharacterized protein LOC122092392 [Macadamia integrifolia]
MAPFEALYGNKCKTPLYWDEVGERRILGTKLIQPTYEKIDIITERIKAAQSKQKCYADKRRKPLEFEVADKVFLKISLVRGVKRFGRRGKLGPRYVGLFEILDRIGQIAYRLGLPLELERFHNVFHVSMLKKYIPNPTHVLPTMESSDLDDDLSYEEQPEGIFDRKEYQLRNRIIPYLKIKWKNHPEQEASLEREDEGKKDILNCLVYQEAMKQKSLGQDQILQSLEEPVGEY